MTAPENDRFQKESAAAGAGGGTAFCLNESDLLLCRIATDVPAERKCAGRVNLFGKPAVGQIAERTDELERQACAGNGLSRRAEIQSAANAYCQ